MGTLDKLAAVPASEDTRTVCTNALRAFQRAQRAWESADMPQSGDLYDALNSTRDAFIVAQAAHYGPAV